MIQALPQSAVSARPEVVSARRRYGIFYGMVVGIAFAAWNWGMDAYQLSQAHAALPWLKFAIGIALCAVTGGIAGWSVMRFERGWAAALAWLMAAIMFAWVSVALTFQVAPRVIRMVQEVPGDMTLSIPQDLFIRVGLSYVWVAIFVLVAGVLELPMGESATFSTNIFGKLGPSLLCVALMGISGFLVDGLNNEPFRNAVLVTDSTIQFALDHQGEQIDPKVTREMHLAALRTIPEMLPKPRRLIVGEYDRWLGEIHVLVQFGDQWADCLTVYNQMSNCGPMTP